jgi:hypothetical protein
MAPRRLAPCTLPPSWNQNVLQIPFSQIPIILSSISQAHNFRAHFGKGGWLMRHSHYKCWKGYRSSCSFLCPIPIRDIAQCLTPKQCPKASMWGWGSAKQCTPQLEGSLSFIKAYIQWLECPRHASYLLGDRLQDAARYREWPCLLQVLWRCLYWATHVWLDPALFWPVLNSCSTYGTLFLWKLQPEHWEGNSNMIFLDIWLHSDEQRAWRSQFPSNSEKSLVLKINNCS